MEARIQAYFGDKVTPAHLKMADTPAGTHKSVQLPVPHMKLDQATCISFTCTVRCTPCPCTALNPATNTPPAPLWRCWSAAHACTMPATQGRHYPPVYHASTTPCALLICIPISRLPTRPQRSSTIWLSKEPCWVQLISLAGWGRCDPSTRRSPYGCIGLAHLVMSASPGQPHVLHVTSRTTGQQYVHPVLAHGGKAFLEPWSLCRGGGADRLQPAGQQPLPLPPAAVPQHLRPARGAPPPAAQVAGGPACACGASAVLVM